MNRYYGSISNERQNTLDITHRGLWVEMSYLKRMCPEIKTSPLTPLMKRLTLPYKGLTGVQQNITALHDHSLDREVLADVFCVTHFIMHHSEEKHANTSQYTLNRFKM